MKKIVALLAIMTLLMTGTAFANGKDSDVQIQTLQSAMDSEIIMDEVTVIKTKNGDITRFEITAEPGSEGSMDLQTDPEKGTYKATEETVPDSIKDRIMTPHQLYQPDRVPQ